MEELRQILTDHASRYPLMEPCDAVKLIYQNEFGGGHLITDPAAFLSYLRQEYEATSHDPAVPLWEPLGNGIGRIHLASLEEKDLDALGQAFLRSTQMTAGSLSRFLEKLDILRCLTAQCYFSFDLSSLEAYLERYTRAGYPAVSHSEIYRNAYHPAYRIILAIYKNF